MRNLIPAGVSFLGYMDGMNVKKKNGKIEGIRFTREKSCLLSHPNAKCMFVVPNVEGSEWPSAKSCVQKSKKVFRLWSHFAAREEFLIKRPLLDAFYAIGYVMDIFYTSDKFSKKWTKYYHEFNIMPVVMRGLHNDKTVSNVFKIQPVRITSAGIEDCHA